MVRISGAIFGIVSGPLLWARVAALVMRFTAALHPKKTNQHTYVDDPLAVTVGTYATSKRRFAMMILLWRILGFKLSIRKGAFGQRVAWVGLEFVATSTYIQATINPDKIEKAALTTAEFLDKTLIKRGRLIHLGYRLGFRWLTILEPTPTGHPQDWNDQVRNPQD